MTSADWILLVEDNEVDVEVFQDAIARGTVRPELRSAATSAAALQLLDRLAGAPPPALIVLDLNLPDAEGHVALARLKQNPSQRAIPVVVLTTSQDSAEVQACYDAGASSFLVKPFQLTDYRALVRKLIDYWFGTVVLPCRAVKS